MTDTPRPFVSDVQRPRPASPPSRGRTGLVAIAATAAAVLLAVGGVAGAMLVSGKGPIDAIRAAIGAGSFTVSGSVSLTGDSVAVSTTCGGKGSLADIAEGAAVTVSDAAGAVVGIGRLGAGHLETAGCVLDFAIPDITAGKGFYGLEVSHRGAVKYSEAEISSGRVALGLS